MTWLREGFIAGLIGGGSVAALIFVLAALHL
jgi:hypothetical protein